MATPPSSLPSPPPSSSWSHQPHSFSSMLQGAPLGAPGRVPSAASHLPGRESKTGHYMRNGNASGEDYSPSFDSPFGYGDPMLAHSSQQTPQPHPGSHFPTSNPSGLLPQMTASPPPQAPTYIPPPQHAMAPDPIHSMTMSMMVAQQGAGGMMGPLPGMAWSNGPNQWRPGPNSYPGPTPYPRSTLPNGHAVGQHQLPPNPLDPFASSRPSMTMPGPISGNSAATVAMLQQAILAASGSARPGSAHGEGRERRRDRERSHRDEERIDGEKEGGRDEPEIITTIFVVGFPDDMGEREFQNIFTFSSGFEAATLKFPSGSTRREPAAALLAELSQLAANQSVGGGDHGEMPSIGLEEALTALQMGGTATTSSSTTPSAAMSLTPSAPSGPTFGGPSTLPQLPTRRQTIGFARFKTGADAVAAKEHMQGRKIDSLTGATLKAEMAKKNLHTKRATSGEEMVGLLLKSGRLAGLMAAGQQNQANMAAGNAGPSGIMTLPHAQTQQVPSAREAWESWTGQGGERERAMEDPRSMPQSSAYPTSAYPYPTSHAPQHLPVPASTQSNASTSPPLSVKSPMERPTDSKALLALAEEEDELEGWSVGGAVGMGMGLDGFTSRRSEREPERSSGSGTQPMSISNMQQSALNHGINQSANSYGRSDQVNYGSSPPGGSDHMSEAGRSMGGAANPADQNPPINTLYVGNLPAISPPTHPPNFLEESLRALFSRCQGFKRMSFRQKINGPMCFVEFEEVQSASQAIKDLYGHNLGGLVKGGIRLSYSKNSLGQRGNSYPTGINTSMFGGIAHTVALAGMSSPSTSTSQPGPPGQGYGSQLQPGNGPSPQSAPAPITLQRSGPSSGEGTSLSPTAQPFNATSPMATSPRSRYFTSSPPNSADQLQHHQQQQHQQQHQQLQQQQLQAQGGYNSYPLNPNSQPPPAIPGGGIGGSSGGFSPVSSPIRTPASYSWVSSGASNGYGFDPFAGHGMSLAGAASAWGQGGNGGNSNSGGNGNGNGGQQ